MIEFRVYGIPKPGGSKRAFYNKATGRAMIVDTCKGNKDWRSLVALTASEVAPKELLDKPLSVEMEFIMPRPQSHYRTKSGERVLRDNAPWCHTNKPDVLKLGRSTEDALTGVLWRDDSLICEETLTKHYGDRPGVTVKVWKL